LLAELAADAGGRLDVESQPGIGTTLRLRVPRP
jgi:signal transduction histidine kinase